jgi:23S rRNA (adenine-N6)-dimethyltransferase
MAKPLRKRIALAQHFLHNLHLVGTLVRESGLAPADTVVEIGAGQGILTEALAAVAGRVIAIEKDPVLVAQLRQRFRQQNRVEVRASDFLTMPLDLEDYTVFANIPFNRTARIMHKLFDGPRPPRVAYLVMQREAAQKFAGVPRETQSSLLLKPHFAVEIGRKLRRTDFDPPPRVEAVLLQMKRRDPPLLADTDAEHYRRFVSYGFQRGRHNLWLTYKPLFTYRQWKRVAHDLRFARNATATQLSFAQWLELFGRYQHLVPPAKQALIPAGFLGEQVQVL